jgi:hypothetical protein
MEEELFSIDVEDVFGRPKFAIALSKDFLTNYK